MIFKTFKTAFALSALVFSTFTVSVSAQEISSARVAGLFEDVAALRSEVERLRTEVDELRAENARLLQLASKKIDPNDAFAAKINALRAEFNESLQTQRREMTTETDKKIAALAEMTNRALGDLSKNINRVSAEKSEPAPVAKPKDFPSSGIEYVVKNGDTLGKIIARNGSRKDWILYANPGLDPDKIFVGQKLFVPQKD